MKCTRVTLMRLYAISGGMRRFREEEHRQLQRVALQGRRFAGCTTNGITGDDDADWHDFAAGVDVFRPSREGVAITQTTIADTTTAQNAEKTRRFLRLVLSLPSEQEATDMVVAALRLGTLRRHHVDALINAAKRIAPRLEKPSQWGEEGGDARSGNNKETADGSSAAPPLPWHRVKQLLTEAIATFGDPTAWRQSDGGDGSAAKRGPAAMDVHKAYIDTLLDEAACNALLAAMLSHVPVTMRPESLGEQQQAMPAGGGGGGTTRRRGGSRDDDDGKAEGGEETQRREEAPQTADVAALRILAEASWGLCGFMERRGLRISNPLSLDILGRLLEAFQGKTINPTASASQYTARKEFLDNQQRALQVMALTGAQSPLPTAGPRVQRQPLPAPHVSPRHGDSNG